MQAIAVAMSDGRLAVVECLDEDDWEDMAEALASGSSEDDLCSIRTRAASLPDDCSMSSVRCAQKGVLLHGG